MSDEDNDIPDDDEYIEDMPDDYDEENDMPDKEGYSGPISKSTSNGIEDALRLVAYARMFLLLPLKYKFNSKAAQAAIQIIRTKNRADLNDARTFLLSKLDEAIKENPNAVRNDKFRCKHTKIFKSNAENFKQIIDYIVDLRRYLEDYYVEFQDPYYLLDWNAPGTI